MYFKALILQNIKFQVLNIKSVYKFFFYHYTANIDGKMVLINFI